MGEQTGEGGHGDSQDALEGSPRQPRQERKDWGLKEHLQEELR